MKFFYKMTQIFIEDYLLCLNKGIKKINFLDKDAIFLILEIKLKIKLKGKFQAL